MQNLLDACTRNKYVNYHNCGKKGDSCNGGGGNGADRYPCHKARIQENRESHIIAIVYGHLKLL